MAGQRYCRHIDDKPRNVANPPPLNDASAPAEQRQHAQPATLVHADAGGQSPAAQSRRRATQKSAAQARVHSHGSDHQPGQGESSTAARTAAAPSLSLLRALAF